MLKMSINQIAVISLCSVIVNSLTVSGKRDHGYENQNYVRTTTMKNKFGLLTAGFCKTIQNTKPDPIDNDSSWPWWYEPCEQILKDDFMRNQKKKFLQPVHDFIKTMTAQQNKTALENKIKDIMKNMGN